MKIISKKTIAVFSILNVSVDGFTSTTTSSACGQSTTALNFFGGGSGAKDLDEEVSLILPECKFSQVILKQIRF